MVRPQRDISQVLDPGLDGEAGRDRLDLLRKNLQPRTADKPLSIDRLTRLADDFVAGSVPLPSLLKQYYGQTDSGRWPIVVVRPTDPAKLDDLERQLIAVGFMVEGTLEQAYKRVALLPLRVPPEPCVVKAIASRDDVSRVERSWVKGSLGEAPIPDDKPIVHPDNLLNRQILPSELLSKRDPLRIGLIDSGIDATHPALKTRLMDQRAFRRGVAGVGDQLGHGTAAAGVMARLCTAAQFLVAKVLDKNARGNLDDMIRAVGWLQKHQPDLIVCNVLFSSIPADGRSVLSGLLTACVKQGIVVIVPSADNAGDIATPGNTPGIVSVAPMSASSATAAMIRAAGHHVLAPRGIQASDELFPELDYPSWTVFSGPSAAAAVVAGTAGLLIRIARLMRRKPSPQEIVHALTDGCDNDARLNADSALNNYLQYVVRVGGNLGEADDTVAQPMGAPGVSGNPAFYAENPTAMGRVPNSVLEAASLPPSSDTDLTMPLSDQTRRALAELERRHLEGNAATPQETADMFDAATIQSEIPEEVRSLALNEIELDPDDKPEWWPETDSISGDTLRARSGSSDSGES